MSRAADILDHLPIPVLQIDHQGRLRYWNHTAAIFWNHPPEEAVGEMFHELLRCRFAGTKAEIIDRVRGHCEQAVKSGQSAEDILETASGQTIRLWCSPFLDPEDLKPGALIVLEDITAQQLTREKQLERERLLGAVEMAKTAAHKLNQPLQVILGYVSLMMLDLEPKHPHRDFLSKILEQIEQAQKITQNLNNVTRYAVIEHPDGQRLLDLEQAYSLKDVPCRNK